MNSSTASSAHADRVATFVKKADPDLTISKHPDGTIRIDNGSVKWVMKKFWSDIAKPVGKVALYVVAAIAALFALIAAVRALRGNRFPRTSS